LMLWMILIFQLTLSLFWLIIILLRRRVSDLSKFTLEQWSSFRFSSCFLCWLLQTNKMAVNRQNCTTIVREWADTPSLLRCRRPKIR
jgi:hypothetical protein